MTHGNVSFRAARGIDELERRPSLPPVALLPMLRVLSSGLDGNRARFTELALNRFNTITDPTIDALYISAVFSVDSAVAMNALMQGLRTTFSCVFEGFSRELSSHYIINTNCNALYSPIHYRKVANM